ncbi:MAG: formate dehydrogenase accessory sulfurtransferase FdhD [Finegoldia sp.]|nr:formate dehydrogenase accessory sulfurtransferase FdhD [Finegoldia sp.]
MAIENKVKAKRYENHTTKIIEDTVLSDYVLSVNLNGSPLVKLLCIERELEELVLGYLYSEKIISSIEDCKLDFKADQCDVKVKADPGSLEVVTDSGDYTDIPYSFKTSEREIAPIDWEEETLLKISNYNLQGTDLFKRTGNVHSVILARGEEIIAHCVDIGRYNAFDKAVGTCLKKGESFKNLVAFTSGRIPLSTVQACINTGIPVLVSRAAPTVNSIRLAQEKKLSLIGFCKGEAMTIYSDMRRLK